MDNNTNQMAPDTAVAADLFSQLSAETQDAIIDLLKSLSSEQQ